MKVLGGRYKPIEPLKMEGSGGGQGEVWLAHLMGPDGVTNTVVLKRAHASDDAAVASTTRATTLQEARLSFKLNHENICKVTDVFEEHGGPHGGLWIVYELIQGVTVEKLWTTKSLTVPQICLMLVQTAKGLDFAHRLGVIHRDVTPDNLMVSCTGHLKIIDFGIAKIIDTGLIAQILSAAADHTSPLVLRTKDGQVKGKPGYFSPDILRGMKDPLCDIFNIGLVGFELFTGRRAYPATARFEEQVAQMLEANLPSLRQAATGIDPRLADLVDSLLQKDRSKRIQSAWNVYERIAEICPESLLPTTERSLAALATRYANLRRTSTFKAMGSPTAAPEPLLPASVAGHGTPPRAVEPAAPPLGVAAARTLGGHVQLNGLQAPPAAMKVPPAPAPPVARRAPPPPDGGGVVRELMPSGADAETYRMNTHEQLDFLVKNQPAQGIKKGSLDASLAQGASPSVPSVDEKVMVDLDGGDDVSRASRACVTPAPATAPARRRMVIGTLGVVVAAIAGGLYIALTSFLNHSPVQSPPRSQPQSLVEIPSASPLDTIAPPTTEPPLAPPTEPKRSHHRKAHGSDVAVRPVDEDEEPSSPKSETAIEVQFHATGGRGNGGTAWRNHSLCTVSIDGVKAGAAPHTFPVTATVHRVEVRCDNGQSFMKVVDVASGRVQFVDIPDAPGSR